MAPRVGNGISFSGSEILLVSTSESRDFHEWDSRKSTGVRGTPFSGNGISTNGHWHFHEWGSANFIGLHEWAMGFHCIPRAAPVQPTCESIVSRASSLLDTAIGG